MRIKSLFMAFLACGLALVACKKEQNPNDLPPSIEVTPTTVSFEQSEGSQKLAVKSTRSWTVSGVPEWIALTPAAGEASVNATEVILSVLSNTGNDREATLSFSIGLAKTAVTVKQKGAKGEIDNGKGTKESPYTVAGVLSYLSTLGADVNSPEKVYVHGKVSRIADKGTFGESGTYGNATFYISDDGSQANEFYCYRILYLGNKKYTSGTDVKVGDDVIIYGNVVNFKGNTPETVQGSSFLYSLNGVTDGGDGPNTGGDPKGSGTKDDPYNVAAAINAVKDLTWTANDNYQKVGPYYVKGKISKIADKGTFTEGGTYGNASFYITDDGTGNEFYCFRILYLGNKKYTSGTDIKVGDEVIIYGELMNYRGNTPETVSNSCYLYSLNGNTGGDDPGPGPGGDPKGSGTKDDPYNVAAALNAVKNLTWTANDNYQKVGPYYVQGKISKIADNGAYSQSGTYGNATFYISDDGSQSNEFYCYRILYLGNQKYTSGTDIKVGDEVIIYGELMNYRGNTPETVSNAAYLYSLNGNTGGDDPGPGPGPDPGDPSGSGTQADPYNVAAAINAVKDLTWTSNTDYQKVGPYYVKGKISKIADKGTYAESGTYGNATFNISDDGSQNNEFNCYRLLYLGNQKYTSGTDIKVGDEVIIYGELMNYRGNTPETVSNAAYLYSLNGNTGGDDPGPGPGPDPGDAIAVTVAEFIAAAESETQVYQLTGTIGGTINSTYGNFDLTDDSGTVYVYGLTATNLGYGASNDKSYASLGLAAGDKITIKGYRGSYGEKVEVVYAWFVEKVSGGDPGPGPEPGGDFTSNVTWTAGSDNSYDQDATVNGTTGVKVLKLGKGSDYGKSTLTLPAGSTTLSFYAVSWNNADVANLVFSVNGQEVATVTPKANSGLAGNPTYTLTVSDSDHYTVNLGSAATTVEVKTAGGYRAALFGIIAK